MKKGEDMIIQMAENFLREYIVPGETYKPVEFERDIFNLSAGAGLSACLSGDPIFNRSPFGKALSRMVESGEIKTWQDARSHWCYQRAQKETSAPFGRCEKCDTPLEPTAEFFKGTEDDKH